jgi:hypothetical protein
LPFKCNLHRYTAGTALPEAGAVYPPALTGYQLPTALSNASGLVARFQYSLRCNPAKMTVQEAASVAALITSSAGTATNDRFDMVGDVGAVCLVLNT